MDTKRSMTRSPVRLARTALRVARDSFPVYSSEFSRHDFTVQQHFAMLALKQFFQTDYRGIVVLLSEMRELREVLEIDYVPHYTTLQKAHARLIKKGGLSEASKPFSVLLEGAA